MKHALDIFLNLFLGAVALLLLWIFCQVFLLASFRIPSDSMEPGLVEGDGVFKKNTDFLKLIKIPNRNKNSDVSKTCYLKKQLFLSLYIFPNINHKKCNSKGLSLSNNFPVLITISFN